MATPAAASPARGEVRGIVPKLMVRHRQWETAAPALKDVEPLAPPK